MRKKTSEIMQPQQVIVATVETGVAEKIKLAEEDFFESIRKEREARVAHMGKLFAEERDI